MRLSEKGKGAAILGSGYDNPRRFPAPWTIEDYPACFIVSDANGQALGHFYYQDELGSAALTTGFALGLLPVLSNDDCFVARNGTPHFVAVLPSHRLVRKS